MGLDLRLLINCGVGTGTEVDRVKAQGSQVHIGSLCCGKPAGSKSVGTKTRRSVVSIKYTRGQPFQRPALLCYFQGMMVGRPGGVQIMDTSEAAVTFSEGQPYFFDFKVFLVEGGPGFLASGTT